MKITLDQYEDNNIKVLVLKPENYGDTMQLDNLSACLRANKIKNQWESTCEQHEVGRKLIIELTKK